MQMHDYRSVSVRLIEITPSWKESPSDRNPAVFRSTFDRNVVVKCYDQGRLPP